MTQTRTFIISIAVILTASLWGCGDKLHYTDVAEGDYEDLVPTIDDQSSDLWLFELKGRAKRVSKTTFYNVTPTDDPDSVTIDTLPDHRFETTIYFDTLGNYVARRGEKIERDASGRIVKWRDARPARKKLHPGFLRDTLTYREISRNVMESVGMGDYAITARDDRGNIVGQYLKPLVQGEQNACFNIIRKTDDRGNWTERLTVWTTSSTGSQPHVSYSLDRREIIYYKK